eukprot:TRINITY_DN9984_c0_g1_i1.p1 TRINITY_DN9984_c0_g1~~TRINITY_DN9984_c0_g1_i1.p1  ORF type:complete len:377 (-),score=78.95 TRINITY_DN9984_c0_g1_i1:777-1907(-)
MDDIRSAIGRSIDTLPTPCIILHRSVIERNCTTMLQRAQSYGCQLRPHMKTHKTVHISVLQTNGTRRRIVVSTLAEARFYAAAGFDDILYALPITSDKVERCAALLVQLEVFHVYVDNFAGLRALEEYASTHALSKRWSVFLAVDSGYHREGVDADDPQSVELAKQISTGAFTHLAGIYSHAGHSYSARSAEEIRAIAASDRDVMVRFAEQLRAAGISVPIVSVGATPVCSQPPEHLHGVTEMHPGNYALYDYMQTLIGSCSLEDVACTVLTRIVSQYPTRGTMLIDAGALALSKDTGCGAEYGHIVGHANWQLKAVTQEAGKAFGVSAEEMGQYPVGTMLKVLPNHSCLTCACHPVLYVEDQGVVVDVWTPDRGW